ncbi:MAG: ribosome-associated translation inhibitor RaiA [Verrucomicrobiota bacterium]|jgi:ribosomal subunit interface protein|nr:ribosome-associated translation inhibitor RaiA [Verrucomicrobiota bacterium]
MDIQITGRNVEVNEAIHEYVMDRLEPILAEYSRVETCHVIFLNEKYRFTATIVVQGREKLTAEAQETTDDLYTAFDAALLKVDKQLRKAHDKMVDRHHERQRLADAEIVPE